MLIKYTICLMSEIELSCKLRNGKPSNKFREYLYQALKACALVRH